MKSNMIKFIINSTCCATSKIIFILFMICSFIVPMTSYAYNLSNPGYDSPINPFDQWGHNWYECTRYAFGRTYEKTGIILTFSISSGRHGGKWLDIVKNLPRTTENNPRNNSIAVWKHGQYGHVAFVESVQGNNVIITEANWHNPTDGIVRGPHTLTKGQMAQRGSYTLAGYIYLDNSQSDSLVISSFHRRPDPIRESNQNGHNNFDAQFTVKNYGSSSKRIDNMAIDIINQNGTRFAMWVKGSSTNLAPGASFSTGKQYEELWYHGSYAVEARLQVDGEWSTYYREVFQVLDGDSGGDDPPGGGSGDADISIDKVEIKKTGESDSHFRHSFTVTSGNNNRLNIEAKVKNKKGDDVYADIYYYWDDDKHFSYKSSHKLGDDTHVKIDGHDDVKKHLGNVHIPDEPGSHYFYIYVKAPGDTDKSSSSNHDEYGKVTVLPQTHPDLVVQSPAVNQVSLAPGQAFSVSAVVKNQGNGSSPGTTLRYYRSTNTNISRSDTQLATDSVSSLSANATSSESATISAPTMPGTYWIGACVDEVNEESDKGNNCSSGIVITVSNPTHPDLVVQSPSVSNSTLTPGQSFTVYATVKNQDNGSSSATTLRYYRSTNSTISISDTEIGTDSVSALSAGSSSSEDKGNRVAPSTPGTYWVGACVDSVSGESNTGNNCSAGVQITVSNPAYPDLIVQSPSVDDNTLTPGQHFTMYATVHNAGNASSSATTLRYYRSTNPTISTNDTEIGTDSVDALSAGGSSSEDKSNRVAPSTPGTYWVGACVDSVSGESNTGNNCSAGVQITVANQTYPDLVVQFPSVDDNTLTPGQHFTIYVTVHNGGNASASATTLRYYRSTNSTISTSDTEIGTDSVSALSAGSSSPEDKGNRVAPSTPGTYWIGACVESVSGESNTGNNCSTGVQITVSNIDPENTNIVPILQLLLSRPSTIEFNGLEWQDINSSQVLELNWADSLLYCSNLQLNGKADWRLPNIDELREAYQLTSHPLAVIPTGWIWSSSEYAEDPLRAYFIYGNNSSFWAIGYKGQTAKAHCVRDMN